jgi:hypothetical protein
VTPLARALSIVLHPFATMLAFALLAGGAGGNRGEALLVAAAVIVPVAALTAQRRRSGRWRTVDASERAERPALYAVAGVAAAVAAAAVLLRGGPSATRPALAVLLVFALGAAASPWVKASLHVAFATFAGAALLALGVRAGWVFLALSPPLAWSRLRLGRHTRAELAAGAAIGAAGALVLALR